MMLVVYYLGTQKVISRISWCTNATDAYLGPVLLGEVLGIARPHNHGRERVHIL